MSWDAIVSGASTVIVGVLAWIGGARRGRSEARKLDAEAETTLSAGWQRLVDQLSKDVDELRAEVRELRDRVATSEAAAAEAERRGREDRAQLALAVAWIAESWRREDAGLGPQTRPTHIVTLVHGTDQD